MNKKKKKIKLYNSDLKFYIMMIIFVLAFWVFFHIIGISPLKDVITTTTGLIAAVMVWLQLKRTERLNESAYIKDFNNQFITNKDMTKVEHALELYYNQMLEGVENPTLQLNLSRESEDCQKLINYLVYLESLATVVQQRVMHIENIHNLFAYRFFIAVNNPIVQMFEIYPYAEYYQGLFFLSEYWTSKCKQKNSRFTMNIPMSQFALRIEKRLSASTVTRKAKKQDSPDIARILYQTDPYIYPAAFGTDADKASKAMSKLIEKDEGLLSYKNIYVIANENKISGIALCVKGKCEWNTKTYIDAMGESLIDKKAFTTVSNEYFSKQTSYEDSVSLVAFAVDETCRRQHNGYHLMSYISNIFIENKMELDVLCENNIAANIYKKYGFVVQSEKDGFAMQEENKPKVYHMVRPSLIAIKDNE